MLLTRISAFDISKGSRVLDGIVVESNSRRALERFRDNHPEYKECIVAAEVIDSNDPKWREYIETCMKWNNIY